MRLTVPEQYPGAGSLPAELKVGRSRRTEHGFPWARLRAEHAGRVEGDSYERALAGLGYDQTVCDPTDPSFCTVFSTPDIFSAIPLPEAPLPPAGWGGPARVPPNVNPPPPPAGYQWVQALDASGNIIAKVLAVAQGGGAVQNRYGQVIAGSPASALALGPGGQVGGSFSLGPGGVNAGFGFGGGTIALVVGLGLLFMLGRGGGGGR